MKNKNVSSKTNILVILFALILFSASIAFNILYAVPTVEGMKLHTYPGRYILPYCSLIAAIFTFSLLRTNKHLALGFALIATLLSLMDFLVIVPSPASVIRRDFWNFFRLVYCFILNVLLIIFCASYQKRSGYLLACMASSLQFIMVFSNLIKAPRGLETIFYEYFMRTAVYIIGFLSIYTNDNPITHKKQKGDITAMLSSLEKFAQLKEEGILTAEEFEAKKQELMNQM